jgi:membrane-associated phospholipid phosphatase
LTRRPRFPIPLVVLAFGSSLLFATIAAAVANGDPVPADSGVLSTLERGKSWSPLRDVVSGLGVLGGAPAVIAITALAMSILLVVRRRGAAAFFLGCVAVSALNPLLKEIFGRVPPALDHPQPGEAGFFPSGHATGSMAVAAAILVAVWDSRFRLRVSAVAVVLVAAVGLSALYDGGHWPSDVVGGWALSVAWVASLCCLLSRP